MGDCLSYLLPSAFCHLPSSFLLSYLLPPASCPLPSSTNTHAPLKTQELAAQGTMERKILYSRNDRLG